MEILLFLELLIFFSLTNVRVSMCFNITIIYFRKVGQHPQINKCALTMIQKNEHFAMRVHNVKEMCEGLPREWSINKIMDNEYSYVTRMQTQLYINPQLEIPICFWKLPGLFVDGDIFEVNGRIPYRFNIMALDFLSDSSLIPLHLKIDRKDVQLFEFIDDEWRRRLSPGKFEELDAGKAFHFTFVAEKTSIRIFLNKREIIPKYEPVSPLTIITNVWAYVFDHDRPVHAINMLKYVNNDD